MATRIFLCLADATNKCVLTVPTHTIRLNVPNTHKNLRNFKRWTNSARRSENAFKSVNTQATSLSFSNLIKPLGFTVVFTGSTIIGTAIWEYEHVRKQTYRIINHFNQYRGIKKGWRKEMETWWKGLTDGQKMFVPICFLNVLVFLAWRVPAYRNTMIKYFSASPTHSGSLCWPMLLSTFSHYSFLHLAANMYVLHTFSTAIVAALGREQFLALYLSSGVISSFAGYLYKVAAGVPGVSLGASGAIMGILGYVCTQFPDIRLAILFLPTFTFTAGMAIKVMMGVDLLGCLLKWKFLDHAAHLGGACFGIFWQAWGRANIWQNRKPILEVWHDLREPRRPQ